MTDELLEFDEDLEDLEEEIETGISVLSNMDDTSKALRVRPHAILNLSGLATHSLGGQEPP